MLQALHMVTVKGRFGYHQESSLTFDHIQPGQTRFNFRANAALCCTHLSFRWREAHTQSTPQQIPKWQVVQWQIRVLVGGEEELPRCHPQDNGQDGRVLAWVPRPPPPPPLLTPFSSIVEPGSRLSSNIRCNFIGCLS